MLKIHFTNRANRNFSVHPHGVFYLKDSEGALYNDNTAGRNKVSDSTSSSLSEDIIIIIYSYVSITNKVIIFFSQEDDGVPPNGKHTYTWEVKREHGPTKSDSDCLTWAYHSHINPRNDVNTGLVGSYFYKDLKAIWRP